jgi:hypothetical protein
MNDAAAVASDDVWAVGWMISSSIIQHWNGSRWNWCPAHKSKAAMIIIEAARLIDGPAESQPHLRFRVFVGDGVVCLRELSLN